MQGVCLCHKGGGWGVCPCATDSDGAGGCHKRGWVGEQNTKPCTIEK